MQFMLTVAGFVLVLLVFVVIVSLCFAVIESIVEKRRKIREELVRRDERHHLGYMLSLHAWWFSEDRETLTLLQVVANDMLIGRLPLTDVEQVRERWRAARTAKTVKDGQDELARMNITLARMVEPGP